MGWKSKGRGGTLVDNEEKKEDGATCCLTLPLKLENGSPIILKSVSRLHGSCIIRWFMPS